MRRDEVAQQAGEPIDWSTAQVDTTDRRTRAAYTVSFDSDDKLIQWLEAEAGRRGMNPIELMRDLLGEAYRRAA
ncbi:hypothetical protein DKT69_20925 [Micromonospora sicca]|uniref:Uncharacterized protein n=1 Tax=Micromonospora sicca TaxID=2202420 RepID=A0A317DI24_9ACTN|nr:hypothetical protein [Micromonospora sp. 4G51]PWR13386.1 hypothetical protein DKT69_20925 [Micromonospora sp. 4G51]